MAGPVIFTEIFAQAVAHKGGWLPAGAPYYLAGALLVVSLLIARWITWASPE
jgi:hypothetical protein